MPADLTTYDGLVSAVGDWLNRVDLTDSIPTFIRLAELSMSTDPRIKPQSLLTRSQAILVGEYTTVPADYNEMQKLRVLGAPGTVEYVTPADLDEMRCVYATPGRPRFFTVVGRALEVLPVPDAASAYALEMLYYKTPTPLSPTNQSNEISRNHSDLYLYGALIASAPYLKDDDRLQTWVGIYSQLADKLAIHTEHAKYGGAPLKMRSRRF